MAKILLVDDEVNILSALRRTLNARDDFDNSKLGYEIYCCNSAKKALKESENTIFDLVLSDYRMPEMDGIIFLSEFRYIQPHAARIIISGMADLSALVRAINEVEIYRFLSKPWNDFELRSTVEGALRSNRLIAENQRLSDELRELKVRSNRQEAELLRIEKETPGITKVEWQDNGSILLKDI